MSNGESTKSLLKSITAIFFVVIIIASLFAMVLPASANQIFASDCAFGFKDFFGEDEMVCVSGDLDPTGEDFIFPTARIYVANNQVWSGSAGLSDVTAGGYNVIQGTSLGGAFFDEIVWLPPLTRGRYDLVIDENQNGIFDGIDYVAGESTNWAFQVGAPVGVSIDVAAIKGWAGTLFDRYDSMANNWHWISDSATAVSIGWAIASGDWVSTAVGIVGAVTGLPTDYNSGVLNIGGKVIERLARPIADHWGTLRDDPPDPDFTTFASIDMNAINSELAAQLGFPGIPDAYPFAPRGNSSYERAQIDFSNNMAVQAAIVNALQSSIEKFQGAEGAGDDEFIYLQAQAVKKFSDMLAVNMNDTRQALQNYRAEQIAFGLDDPVYNASEIQALKDRLATTGLTPNEVEDLKDSGFTDADIAAMMDRVAGLEVPSVDFTRAETIEDLVAEINNAIPTVQDLSNQAQAVMDDLNPFVEKHYPIADPGGPYTGDEGSPITFDGTGSSDPDSDALTYEWDFDLDGNFDDASGAIVTWTFDSAFSGVIGLKVTDTAGLSDIAYASVTVSSIGVLGDINKDGVVDISDVILVLRIALQLDPIQSCSDINGDGVVDISDVILTLRMALGLDPLQECL